MSSSRKSLLIVFLLLLGLAIPQRGEAAPVPKPNVIVITVDTLRADHVGAYGYARARTPNIDALAASGVRFEKAYTPVPITLPSHACLMTGTYPMRNGMHDFSGNRLDPAMPTLASVLKAQGYATGAVLGAAVLDRRFGLHQGFDFYYDHFDFNRMLETNLDAMERPGNLVMDQALAWLRKNSARRLFLWVHLYDPHHPYSPPPPYDAQFKDNPYDGEIAFADAQIGRLLRYLKLGGLLSNTLIVFASDHGEGLGEHAEKTHGFFIYNSTLHVPLVMKLPASAAVARKQVADAVSLVDVMPTVLDALRIPPPAQVQGRSLLPLLQAKGEAGESHLYAESYLPRLHFNWSELRGLQAGNYRLIDGPKPELYDLAKDPGELQNLFEQKPAVAGELRAQLAGVVQKYSAGTETAQKTSLDPAMAERLQALGYAALPGGSNPTISNRDLPDPKDRIQMYELVSEAINLSQRGNYAASIEKLKAALAIEEGSVPAHYLLGLNYYRQKDFASAVPEFRRVLEKSPDYALAVFNLGLALANLGNFDEAIVTLKRTLELDPSNFSAAFDLGALYLKKNMFDESIAAFRQSVTIHPGFAPGRRALGEMLLFRGQVDKAIAELREAARLTPNDGRIHLALAKALEAKGLHREAAQARLKAQELGTQAPARAPGSERRP
jgi:arylsulfatase A-like enzyme/Flp pilus assembly protein TadD